MPQKNRTRTHKGVTIQFLLPKQLETILENEGIDLTPFISDDHYWFENTLFEFIDENAAPNNKFQIIIQEAEGHAEKVAYNAKNVIGIVTGNHAKIRGLKCIILRKKK